MVTTLALAAALTLVPAQPGTLKLANERATYGIMGAARPDDKVLPGDVYTVTFDIENLTVDDAGKVLYRMGMVMTTSQGKVHFSRDPQDLEIINSLGGTSMPAFAGVEIGTDTAAGEYILTVTVTDRAAKKEVAMVRKFEVLPRAFGLVQVHTTYNLPVDNATAPGIGVAGQSLVVNAAAVGFERGGARKEPNVLVEMQVLDDKGQPTLKKALSAVINGDIARNFEVVPIPFLLALNRPGKFTIKLNATDLISKKASEITLPIVVFDSNIK